MSNCFHFVCLTIWCPLFIGPLFYRRPFAMGQKFLMSMRRPNRLSIVESIKMEMAWPTGYNVFLKDLLYKMRGDNSWLWILFWVFFSLSYRHCEKQSRVLGPPHTYIQIYCFLMNLWRDNEYKSNAETKLSYVITSLFERNENYCEFHNVKMLNNNVAHMDLFFFICFSLRFAFYMKN